MIVIATKKYLENNKTKGFLLKNSNITINGQVLLPEINEPVVPEEGEDVTLAMKPVPRFEVKKLLQQAIQNRLPIMFDYMSLTGRQSSNRRGVPEEIVRANFHDLVVTMDADKNDYRSFVIDGMSNVKLAV